MKEDGPGVLCGTPGSFCVHFRKVRVFFEQNYGLFFRGVICYTVTRGRFIPLL